MQIISGGNFDYNDPVRGSDVLVAHWQKHSLILRFSMSLSPESLYLEAARHSISSNSSSTAPRKSFSTLEEDYDFKKDDYSLIDSKPLPLLPSSISDESNPYSIEYPGSFMT